LRGRRGMKKSAGGGGLNGVGYAWFMAIRAALA